jgi:hypothetical protein
VGGEVNLPGPAAGEGNQGLPGTGEREMENDADDAIIVVPDLSVESFPGIKDEGFGGLDDRRTLVADVAGRGVLQRGLLDRGRAEKLAEAIETDLFRDIELEQNVDGARQSKGWGGGFNGFRHSVKDSTVRERMGWAYPSLVDFLIQEGGGMGKIQRFPLAMMAAEQCCYYMLRNLRNDGAECPDGLSRDDLLPTEKRRK